MATKIIPLSEPIALSLADLVASRQVEQDNPHGFDWKLIESGDQGEDADRLDRFYARFESQQGYWADYFYLLGEGNVPYSSGYWSLGAS